MKILHLDQNHPLLLEELNRAGFENHKDFHSPKAEVENYIQDFEGIVIRSRFPIDRQFLEKAKNLKFIARVGAGLENINKSCARKKGIRLISAPEGNKNAVGEHSLGMLLALTNNMFKAHQEIKNGQWNREANRGTELDGKTIGIIGFGNMGKAFASKLKGFEVEVIFYDLKDNLEVDYARQVPLTELQEKADVLSLHTPLNEKSHYLVDHEFIQKFEKPFWLINTARGKCVNTKDLVQNLKSGKVLGAGLDVLEHEKNSFESLFHESKGQNPELNFLLNAKNTVLTPHIAGWTSESKIKLAKVTARKIINEFA